MCFSPCVGLTTQHQYNGLTELNEDSVFFFSFVAVIGRNLIPFLLWRIPGLAWLNKPDKNSVVISDQGLEKLFFDDSGGSACRN